MLYFFPLLAEAILYAFLIAAFGKNMYLRMSRFIGFVISFHAEGWRRIIFFALSMSSGIVSSNPQKIP